ncbi:GGDEF domain-containing protein [Thiospirillum jenense]|uniref:GGDEF domain-containing protein n=2 Tax=Thiospirillum jenense TaxID=1653858 RepID=A0A839HBF0_9GAMM|nr:GGDEF domain-containing protein [Thiospirillum jenense]
MFSPQQPHWQQLLIVMGSVFTVCLIAIWLSVLSFVKQHRYKARLELLSHYDHLTELPNRTLFFDRLERLHMHVKRYQRRYGLIVVALDGIKNINDRLGHHVGNELLLRVARMLTNSLRQSDTVARLSNYEFAVLLTEIRDPPAALWLGKKVAAALKAPIRLSTGEVELDVSVGVAVFPEHSQDAEEIFRLAYQAMLQVKRLDGESCLGASPQISSLMKEQ